MRGRLVIIALWALMVSLATEGRILSLGRGGGQALGAESDTIEVVATGVGKDSDSALRNALRAAIEQAVGTLLDSETLANNDEVINDKILSYSAGFVQTHKMIGEPRIQDGLVSVKISAVVKRTDLAARLKAASIHVAEVDGESLFGEALTQLENEQAAGDMIRKAFDGFPQNVLEIKGPDLKNRPAYDAGKKKWIVPVEISVNREKYQTFIKNLLPILRKVATHTEKFTFKLERKLEREREPKIHSLVLLNSGDLLSKFSKQPIFAICTQMNDALTNSTWEFFTVHEELLKDLKSLKEATFTVDIVDKQKDSIDTLKQNIPSCSAFGGDRFAKEPPYYIFPVLGDRVSLWYDYRIWDPASRKITFNLEFDISPEEFRRMSNVVCQIE